LSRPVSGFEGKKEGETLIRKKKTKRNGMRKER
jgi:hypothetical protein